VLETVSLLGQLTVAMSVGVRLASADAVVAGGTAVPSGELRALEVLALVVNGLFAVLFVECVWSAACVGWMEASTAAVVDWVQEVRLDVLEVWARRLRRVSRRFCGCCCCRRGAPAEPFQEGGVRGLRKAPQQSRVGETLGLAVYNRHHLVP
jgi:hypothetical protein